MPKFGIARSRWTLAAWPTGRDVARPVPGGADGEELAQRRHLAGHRQAADLRDVDADEVDQPVAIRATIHSLGLLNSSPIAIGRAGLLAELLEVADVLGAERVFEEEQA